MELEKRLSIEIIRVLPKAAIARKYNCSVQYVRKVLIGDCGGSTARAFGIRRDAHAIARILLRETSSGDFSWNNSSEK